MDSPYTKDNTYGYCWHSIDGATPRLDTTHTTPLSNMDDDGDADDMASNSTDDRLSPEPSVYSLTSSLRDQSLRMVHGRSLNAHSDVYSLPADEEEALRLYRQHNMFYYIAGNSDYYGFTDLVSEVLAPTPQRKRRVIDLGCGPGAWAIQCAVDFPHADVLGVDLAPSSAMKPPPNCRFEVDDLNLGLEHFYGDTFDLVHARLLSSGLKDYAGLVDQVSRCIRPGGLVIFSECDLRVWSEDKRLLIPPNFYTPLAPQARPTLGNSGPSRGSSNFSSLSARTQVLTRCTDWALPAWMAITNKCMRAKGGNIDAAILLKTWLRDHPNYERVETRDIWGPVGAWNPTILNEWTTHPHFRMCGQMGADDIACFMKGARPLLYGYLSEQEVSELETRALEEIMGDSHPMYIRMPVTLARKKRSNE